MGRSLFQDYEETIPSAEINDTSYEIHADFHWDEIFFFLKKQKPKKIIFKATNLQFSILEQFLKFKACKSGDIDTHRHTSSSTDIIVSLSGKGLSVSKNRLG